MRTTLKHIAEYLNVSTTTVSRALNDKDDISPETRQKVLRVAKMLDYKPNSVAISLRKKTMSNLIGVILPVVDHYFFSTILHGITTSGQGEDYMVMIGESNHSVEREKEILNRFNDHYVAGIIFIPSRYTGSKMNVKLLQKRSTPFVLIDRTFDDYTGSYIQHNDFQGAYHATTHLIDKGRSKIALLRGEQDCSVSNARMKGFIKALEDHEISFDPEMVIECTDASKREGYDAAKDLFQLNPVPDGIFCITDQLAAGVLECAKESGLGVPEELSVVGYSNSEIAQNVTPKLTTVSQDGFEMGRLAKEYLIEMIHHNETFHQKVFPAELIIRGSS